ncbi:MAG: hypothetical protein ACKVW3_11730 [Phycisphaerales bacterium]
MSDDKTKPQTFEEAVAIAQEAETARPGCVSWTVHKMNPTTRREEVVPGRFGSLDFDEQAFASAYPSGTYRRRLMIAGRKGYLFMTEFHVAEVIARVPAPAPAPPPLPPSPADDRLAALMASMQQQAEEYGRSMRMILERLDRPAAPVPNMGVGVADVIQLISTMIPVLKPPTTPISETIAAIAQLKELAPKLAGDGGGGGTDWAPIVGSVVEALANARAAAPPAPAPRPVRTVEARTVVRHTPAPRVPPPASPAPAPEIRLVPEAAPLTPPTLPDAVAMIVVNAAAIEDADPDVYATLIADALEGSGIDVEAYSKLNESDIASALVALSPSLASCQGWVLRIAGSLRTLYTTEEEVPS